MVWEINDRFGTERWRPVHLIKQALPADRLSVLYRAADLCIVSSLQDGMNLVAKEFVASQVDDAGRAAPVELRRGRRGAGRLPRRQPVRPEDFALRIRDALAHAQRRSGRLAWPGCRARWTRSTTGWTPIFESWGGVAPPDTGARTERPDDEPLEEAEDDDAVAAASR